ncbi:SHOCT domain-containing protein [Cryptosporangium aurantiacum]|uniref:Short C-terminal domain-containing protein n=1 Tax=Cryptosporangium aurantiacum TaxID=134849 RepID=A0A1M7RFP4_9ACTN|nr:SHOCT domain-containing protein [Cryptosporangium aurantiacum]SHN45107.1 Short C-terminal domain-containing protein [Cryptosporangium aurantiacum]
MPGLLRGVARTAVIAGTATAVSNRVSRRQAGRWAAQSQPEPLPPPPPPPPAPAGSGVENQLAALSQLGELKEKGILTEAEFENQKRRILGT